MLLNDNFLDLKRNIIEGRFLLAREILYRIEKPEERNNIINPLLFNMASFGSNAVAYAFNWYLIQQEETSHYHETAAGLLSYIISYYEGTFPSAHYHASRVFALNNENLNYLPYLLYNYGSPNAALTPEESRSVALQMLNYNPQDEFAIQILKETDYLKNSFISPQEDILRLSKSNLNLVVQKYLLRGRLGIAKQFLQKNFSENEIESILFNIADKELNLTPYTLVWDLIQEKETARLHLLGAKIIHELGRKDRAHYIGRLEGTNAVEFFHTFRAAELEPNNLEVQEKLLCLYNSEHESFYRQETKDLVERILKMNPTNVKAQQAKELLF